MSKTTYISILLAGMAVGCNDDATSEKISVSKLLSAELVNTLALSDLQGLARLSGQTSMAELVRHSVSTYKIVYQTKYKGQAINASGLLYIPNDLTGPAPIVSLQHGTTFVKDNAPSTSGSFSGMEYFAAAGYLAVMPDFIGYGTSAEVFHPYYDYDYSAGAVIDMIKACKDFFVREKITFTDQLFLAGYSEGGYVTLAAAKEIDQNPAHDLSVTAVAAGAGGYDLTDMLTNVTSNPHYAYPSYLAFVLMAYNYTYEWNQPLTYFFKPKYAAALDTLMNGKYEGWQINSRLTTEVASLLDDGFLSRLKKDDGEPVLKAALKRNSVQGWKTELPIRLYHGTRDEIIPSSNSEVTLGSFQEAGSKNVSLTLIPGGTHGSAFVPMLQKFVPWFESLRK